MEDTV